MGIRRRLAFVVLATTLAVWLQASEGQAGSNTPHPAGQKREAPVCPTDGPRLGNPAVDPTDRNSMLPGRAAQPNAARNRDPRNDCSREAKAGS